MRCFLFSIACCTTLSGCISIPLPDAVPEQSQSQPGTASGTGILPVPSDIVDSLEEAAATGAMIRVLHSGTGTMRWTTNEDAPVLRVALDYSCAYCKMFEQEVKPVILSTFVQHGKLQLEEVILPLTRQGTSGTSFSLCTMHIPEWENLHAKIFLWPTMPQASFLASVKRTKANVKNVQRCIEKNAAMLIKQQDAWAQEAGIDHVPTSDLLGQRWIGLLDAPETIVRIEEILASYKHGSMP